MASLNKVLLIGNLTRDPERREVNGDTLAEFGLAINRKYKSKSGDSKEDTVFVDVTCWGRTAENVAQFQKKGSQVLVEGRLKFDQWEKDGQKRSKLSVTALQVTFLGGKSKERDDRPSNQEPAAAQGQGVDEDDLPF